MMEDKEEVVQENGQLILFPKKEWDSLVKWEPVAKLDPYEDAPQSVKDYHEYYVKFWLSGGKYGR